MSMKYHVVDDDTAVLFAGNGTALTALLIGVSNVMSLGNIPIPTASMWLYFLGLIFAFLSKAMIQLINGDIVEREKLNSMREFVIESGKNHDLTEELAQQYQETWNLLEKQHEALMKPHHGLRAAKFRAAFFFASSICFLIATSILIYQVGNLPIAFRVTP
jgi:hypothetical protein